MPSRRTRAPNSQLEPSYRSPCDPRQVEHLPSSLWPASPDLTLAEYRYADRRGAGTHIYNFADWSNRPAASAASLPREIVYATVRQPLHR